MINNKYVLFRKIDFGQKNLFLITRYIITIKLQQSVNMVIHSTVVSFDIGKVNMSYCIAKVDNNKPDRPITIIDWSLVNLISEEENETLEIICSKCVSWLKEVFTTNKIRDKRNTWVLVERQRPINPDAFALSYTVFSYFLAKYNNINITFVSAKSKPIEQTGRKRKRAGVKVTKNVLEDLHSNADNDKWSEWFYEQPKKDDLSDSLLQIIGNIENIEVYEENIQDNDVIVID
jgi:Poxvirus A22 protein